MTINMNDLQLLMDRTKIALMQKKDSAFFATIIFSLKQIWDSTCKTAYVDGVHLGWNPEWFMGLTPTQRLAVMVHEGMHIAFDHLGRLRQQTLKRPDLYKQAADHVINNLLEQRGFDLPKPNLCDNRFKGMTTEEVYEILEAEAQQGKNSPPPPWDDLKEDMPLPPGMTEQHLKQHVQEILIRAVNASAMGGDAPGTIPGEIQLMLDHLLNPKLPWTTLLRRYFTEFSKNDYSFKRPNRRHYPEFYLPSLYSTNLQDMTFYVDISGSVMDHQFKIFVSEIAGVLKMLKPKKITVVQFDTQIHHEDTVSNLQELAKIEFHGRGGTHIGCILDHMEQHKNSLSLVFTDGGFGWPRDKFKHKILWLINDNPGWQPAFGDAIHFSTDHTS